MGWTSYEATYYKNGKIDRKAECDSYFIRNSGYEILKSQMVGSVYYAAVKKTGQYVFVGNDGYKCVDLPVDKQYVFAAVVLTSVDMKARDGYNFYYKDIDESLGPGPSNCPESILKLLTPTDSVYANKWRQRCWDNIAKQKEKRKNPHSLANLPIGSVISFVYNDKKYILTKRGPAYQFKKPWWYNSAEHCCVPVKYISDDFTVVSVGAVQGK